MKTKKILSLIMAMVMLLSAFPAVSFATEQTFAEWAGAMNLNGENNYVTAVKSVEAPNMTEMKWAYPLNDKVIAGGAYYAGQSVIADSFLYATGGGKLHKINVETGTGTIINESAGSTVSYYDYLCYADGILVMSTQNSLVAFDTNGAELGSVSGSFGYYHPVQHNGGYVICNGYIYKLEKSEASVSFVQVGDSAIGNDVFNWSSGAFVGELFYVASKTTVYAVDYKTNNVVDSFVFDAESTASNNIQPGVCYDTATGRLFFGTYTYDKYINTIEIDKTEGETKGKFVENSYKRADAGQNTVTTPIVYNGRIYIAGQQGRMCVLNANTLEYEYSYVTIGGGRVQGNPILSCADGKVRIYLQCADGHLYLFTDNGESGSSVKLAETANYTKVQYPNAGFEQYAMDKKGNIYCYNESGYLFCFGESACEVPTFETNLNEKQVKTEKNGQASELVVEASVSDGGVLSYQWQISTDEVNWTDIENAVSDRYTPSTQEEGTFFYRCVVTNTNNGKTAKANSKRANILVKVYSNNATLNVLVNGGNSATSSNPVAAVVQDNILYVTNRSQKVTNLWLGTVSDGAVSSFEILQGLSTTATVPKFTSKLTSNVYNGVTYNGYYRSTSFTLPIVARAEVTAEDGVTKKEYYIVIEENEAVGKYVISVNGFTADSEELFSADKGITFTQAEQTVALTPVTSTLGAGEEASSWKWSSSDPCVATVDEGGKVTSTGGGSATITASCGRIIASCNVTSTAPAHNIHSYTEGICSVCGTKAPEAVSAKFTLTDQNGSVAISKDGETKLYKALVSVTDCDCDGAVTLNDAFIEFHKEYSQNGAEDFESSGGWMRKLWGVNTYNAGYFVNSAQATSLMNPLSAGDEISAFFYVDTVDYSDVFTYFAQSEKTVSAGREAQFEIKGIGAMMGKETVPLGAKVAVSGENGEVATLATTVDAEGKFKVTFPAAGTYFVQVLGTCKYMGEVWDNVSGGNVPKEFEEAPVIPSRIKVEVMPQAEATVYVTVSDKTGNFSVDKNGNEMYRVAVKATDNPENPDGKVSILEVITQAHEQYHPEGGTAFVESNGFITWLWGENTKGSIGYYFNDVYLSGSGNKTGTNGREFEDKLLNTIVADGDSFNIFAMQDTKNWKDMYTYFNPLTQSAVEGEPITLTVKAADYSGVKVPSGALVEVENADGEKIPALSGNVSENGTFTVTFPAAGSYTVIVKSTLTTYFTPSKCLVTVSEKASTEPPAAAWVYISVVDPNGRTYKVKTSYTFENGETAYSLLLKTGLDVKVNGDNGFAGVYIESIEGLGEFDGGSESGWMYKVNGLFPEGSSSLYTLSEGDYVEWVYTRSLGADVGNTFRPSKDKPEQSDKEEEKTSETEKAHSFTDIEKGSWYEEAVNFVFENNLFSGVSETKFAPSEEMTRGMLVTVLHRLEGTDNKGSITFEDVPSGEWYSEAISWAAENEIVNGISETDFDPTSPVTREQLVTILYRYALSKGMVSEKTGSLSEFEDSENVSDWAKEAFNWAVSEGIVQGTSEKTLSPETTATRAQVATIFMRFAEYLAKE